jgi:4-amino-4-deoxy-L-arabinose transferase-like glycosyltransferase
MTTAKRFVPTREWKWVLPLAAVLTLSALLKITLVVLGVVDFTSDEGVIALMARHITQGKWPVFYYGEAYVGSFGATLMAGAFLLLGESVTTARVVQIAFYMGAILFTYLLAQRLFGRKAAVVTALMMALPPVMVTLYTTVGIGAYGETLLFGTLLLWLGHRLAHEWADKWIGWLIWGAVAGLGFWSLGLILVYVTPVAVLWLIRFDRRHWPHYLLAVFGFLLCSSPWWIYDFTHNHACFRVFFGSSDAIRANLPPSLLTRLELFWLLGVPALIGLRFPWAASYILVYLAPLVLTFYIGVLVGIRRRWVHLSPMGKNGVMLLTLFVVGFALLYIGTQFGTDVTGRFLLPMYPPLCIAVGGWWSGLRSRTQAWGSVALALILAFNLSGVVLGAMAPVGLTTLYFPAQQVGNAYDEELIHFLLSNEMPYGYSHHWVSFKLAFLSQEQVILAPLLPYQIAPDHDLDRADRYPPYTALAESAANPVYVTSNQPWLDDLLSQRLMERGVTYEETRIGPYHVFYHLSQPMSPRALGLFSASGKGSIIGTTTLRGK